MSDDASGGEEPSHSDEHAAAPSPTGEATLRTYVAGLSDAARQRLHDTSQHVLVDDPDELASADLVVVSTRLPRADLRPLLASLREAAGKPLVALAHTGGEAIAVEIVRAGGIGVVAEGNEAALRALHEGAPHDQSMVELYDWQLSQAGAFDSLRGHDRTTGLPGAGAFEQRVADLTAGGEIPRVMMLRVIGLRQRDSRLSMEGSNLLRRRLAVSLRQRLHEEEAELYSLDETDFGVIGPGLPAGRAEELARQMGALAETYAPQGNRALALAAGHAGPETSVDLAPLTDIARRALEVAAAERRSNVVSAEELARGVSSTTELEAVQQAVALVERRAHYQEGHGQRVAQWSGEIAWQLGFEGQARTRVQLVGLAHDAGCVGLPGEAMANPAALEGDLLQAYRAHPARGADWLRASCGSDVADAVRAHHEHWDGSGYPDGLAGEEIPMAARIVRLADTLDCLLTGSDPEVTEPVTPVEALVVLEARAGTELDPAVVEVAVPVLDKLMSAREG